MKQTKIQKSKRNLCKISGYERDDIRRREGVTKVNEKQDKGRVELMGNDEIEEEDEKRTRTSGWDQSNQKESRLKSSQTVLHLVQNSDKRGKCGSSSYIRRNMTLNDQVIGLDRSEGGHEESDKEEDEELKLSRKFSNWNVSSNRTGLCLQYGNEQYGNDQYGNAQYGNNQYGNNQYGNDQYGNDQYGNDQYGNDQYGNDQYGNDQYGNDLTNKTDSFI
nr:homeobox protein 2-like [Procambarus clarkii]